MNNQDPVNIERIAELKRLRRRIAELESSLSAGRVETPGPSEKSGEGYRLLFESNPQPMWVYDLETLAVLAVNDAAVGKYGFTREEFLSMTIADIRPPEDIPRLMENIACITCGLDEAGLWLHRKKDGSVIEVEIISHTLTFEGRKAELVLARDVTEQKQTEKALRESEERLRLALKAAAQGLYDLNVQTGEAVVNPEYARMLGYEPDEFVETNSLWIERLHPDDRDNVANTYRTYLSGALPDYQVEFRQQTKSGDWKWILSMGKIVEYDASGKPLRMLGTHTDITARKKAEEALQEGEARMRAVIERAPFGAHSYELQPDGRLILSGANHAADMILGLDHSQLIGKTIEEAFPGLVGTTVPDVYRGIAASGTPHEFEPVDYDRDMIRGSFEIHAFQTGPDRMTVFFRDITERIKAEQERLELERQLLHAQKLESLGVLAGGVAHDFNNLLMAILGNLDMALMKLPPGSPAGMNIEQSAQAARRASDLTRQMLAYSGKGHFLVEQTDLNELVEENVRLFRIAIARTTTLSLHLSRPLPLIEADKGQVQQVIMNLLTNASEAIGNEPGVISLTTGVQKCDAQCLMQGRISDVPPAEKFVYLEVSDSGAGMDEQTQQRLFDPFFTTKTTGRGLGMSAILGIVRGHRGTVFVDSTEGRGTTIRVLFPTLTNAQTEKDTAVSALPDHAGVAPLGGTVLVADDDEMVRDVCREMVMSFGMLVLTASDGREALEVFRQNADRISCVILDLTMPKMDGMTAFRELIRIRPDIKVILSSGYDEQNSSQSLSGQGLAGFIQKPYTLENLHRVLLTAMAK